SRWSMGATNKQRIAGWMIAATVFGAVLSEGARFGLSTLLPPTQVIQQQLPPVARAPGVGKLRDNYPPFVYTLEFDEAGTQTDTTLGFIKNRRQVWLYKLRMANLADDEVRHAQLIISAGR